MALSNTSRYLLTDIVEPRSVITDELTRPAFVDLRQRVTQKAVDDRQIIYDSVDGWGGLGARVMEDATAWWVLADLSGVVNPFEELTEGRQLVAPSMLRYQLSILPSDAGSF